MSKVIAENNNTNELYRLNVAIEDAGRLEYVLQGEGIRYQSYSETVQDFVKVFLFHTSDSARIDAIVREYEIATGYVDRTIITPRSVNANKIALLVTLIILLTALVLLMI
ncbi:MAG: hypothetical protein ACQES0_11060 [Bacteroidota bacterium]